jgi:hypothetical protein
MIWQQNNVSTQNREFYVPTSVLDWNKSNSGVPTVRMYTIYRTLIFSLTQITCFQYFAWRQTPCFAHDNAFPVFFYWPCFLFLWRQARVPTLCFPCYRARKLAKKCTVELIWNHVLPMWSTFIIFLSIFMCGMIWNRPKNLPNDVTGFYFQNVSAICVSNNVYNQRAYNPIQFGRLVRRQS